MNSLESRGIEIITSASLKECKPDSIIYEKDGKSIEVPTMTTVWTASGRANSVVERSGFQTKEGKIEVREDMRTQDFDEEVVIGDCAVIRNAKTEKPKESQRQMREEQTYTV